MPAIDFQPNPSVDVCPMYNARVLLILLMVASTAILGCTNEYCDVGQQLVLLRLHPAPDQIAPDRLGAFWRVNGKRQTKSLGVIGRGDVDRLGICIDPDLSAQGTSELRLTVVGMDPSGSVTLGTELNLQLSQSNPLPEQSAVLRQPRICNSHGWCWLNPQPQGASLAAVASRDSESVWAAGVAGTILHWNGGFWQRLQVPFAGILSTIWVDERDDAWVGGDAGRLYHCNNLGCSEVRTQEAAGSLLAVDGVDANTVYAAGPGALSCSPQGCSPLPGAGSAQLGAVHVVDATTVLFAGSNGTLLRCSPAGCTQLVSGTTSALHAVRMDAAGTIYAVGERGTFVVCKAAGCAVRDTGGTLQLTNLYVASANQVFIQAVEGGLLSCDDASCRQLNPNTGVILTGLYATAPGELFVSGYEQTGFVPGREIYRGLLLRCDATTCTRTLTLDETSTLAAIAGSGADNVWSVGYPGVIAQCDQTSGCKSRSSGPTWTLAGVSGDKNTIWSAGQQGSIVRCDQHTGCAAVPSASSDWQWGTSGGTTDRIWTAGENGSLNTCTASGCMRLQSGTGYMLNPTWPAGPDAAWIGGAGITLLRCDSQLCKSVSTGIVGDLFTLWGAEPDSIWGAGAELSADRKSQHAVVFRCGPTGCVTVTSDFSPSNPESIAGLSTNGERVWVVGQGGMVLLCDGTTCRSLSSGSSEHLLSVYAASAQSAYAVGKNGSVLSCAEPGCRALVSGTAQTLVSVRGSGPNTFWASGGQATLLRCVNDSCSLLPALTNVDFGPLLVPDAQHAWVVGGAGTVLLYDHGLDSSSP